MNQWQNRQVVITWFKSIENKKSSSFIKFNIVEFYPSISKELLTKSIHYAKSITTLEEEVIKPVFHTRKSLLLEKTVFGFREDNSDFLVAKGSYGGAEVCELVGLYLLNMLTYEIVKNNIGLHRDNGLSCFQNISGPDSEKIKKKMCKIFKENELSVTVACNLAINDFLDVNFYLKSVTVPKECRTTRYPIYISNRTIHHL